MFPVIAVYCQEKEKNLWKPLAEPSPFSDHVEWFKHLDNLAEKKGILDYSNEKYPLSIWCSGEDWGWVKVEDFDSTYIHRQGGSR